MVSIIGGVQASDGVDPQPGPKIATYIIRGKINEFSGELNLPGNFAILPTALAASRIDIIHDGIEDLFYWISNRHGTQAIFPSIHHKKTVFLRLTPAVSSCRG